jgi:virginiamycin B lyase
VRSLETAPCREVTLPAGWTPYALAGDAAGNLWMTILTPPGLGRLPVGGDPASEARYEALPQNEGRPMLVTFAADGALWCTRTSTRSAGSPRRVTSP